MNAKDLRIGNIVYYKVEDELDDRKEWNEINIIDAEDILSLEDCESKKQNHPYFPIPLTEEWLEKLGFEKVDNAWINSIALYFDSEEYAYNASYFEYDNLIVIKHVHQLQNLYFALTREELKYKPKK